MNKTLEPLREVLAETKAWLERFGDKYVSERLGDLVQRLAEGDVSAAQSALSESTGSMGSLRDRILGAGNGDTVPLGEEAAVNRHLDQLVNRIRMAATAALTASEAFVFSYGTLQMPRVQRELFGRPIPMTDDALLGYDTVPVEIDHPDVIEFSGSSTHLGLVPGAPDARIAGKLLHVTQADFPALDDYEGSEYRRIEVTLESGACAWVYIKA